jgi:hypothetical protein
VSPQYLAILGHVLTHLTLFLTSASIKGGAVQLSLGVEWGGLPIFWQFRALAHTPLHALPHLSFQGWAVKLIWVGGGGVMQSKAHNSVGPCVDPERLERG